MNPYNHNKIEKKWQKRWLKGKIYKTKNSIASDNKKKFYVLDMFPYPSGEGLHVGHPKGYIATDVYSRHKRMQGYNVLHPMGFDAFGLPAENYAIKNKTNPMIGVAKNVKKYKEQLEILGLDYDWSREINTTDPKYYKWTQWIFLQMFKNGLAYESYEPINWCPSCKTGLANEDVENGRCERCGTIVEKKPMRQWVLRITDYAEKLLNGIDGLDWPNSIKELQKNWIGKSEGTEISFKIKNNNEEIKVFTTRIDTIFSGTFIVVSPRHKIITKLRNDIENINQVEKFIDSVKNKTELERLDKDNKNGIKLEGIFAINPATNEEIEVWVSDFVLEDYGTGAVFADAHDKRDFDMAKKYGISLKISIKPENTDILDKIQNFEECFEGEGILINSQQFNGLKSSEARPKIISWLAEKGLAKPITKYKIRDWVFSRQRYWGEPIPIIHCEKCGVVAVPEKDLPIKLPKVKFYEPTGTGESPLVAISKWVNVKCPQCKGKGKRETNTMPQWAGSSWYYLRYIDPKNKKTFVDLKREKYWSPVDLYVGGAEHATRHLIYARFWHRFLFDNGFVNYPEPFKKLQHVGLIMAEDGRKMSKRWGNVINPDEIVNNLGADTLRIHEMFMGPFDQAIAWDINTIAGSKRFLEKVWKLQEKIGKNSNKNIEVLIHKTLKKVTGDIEEMRFNTAVSSMMILVNEFEKQTKVDRNDYEILLQLLAPFAPHITEEIWSILGNKKSIHLSSWPKYDENKLVKSVLNIMIQINGKVRSQMECAIDISDSELQDMAIQRPEIKKWIEGKIIKKKIIIKGKLINIVI